MSGFAQLLELEVEAGSTTEVRSHVKRIVDNADKMNKLIDGLLNVSNSAHRKLSIQHIDMVRMVEDVLAELGARAHASVEVGALPQVDGDEATIRQVWANLLSNALKYSSRKARPEITVGCEIANSEALFRVQDNGVGFNASYSEKLFGVFSRLHSANEFEGIGIGLAIVRRVIERHGGRVWAESSPNVGATFYFSLPVRNIASP
jgi:light-regulated signal transduction histidine kinase (bacteriophytochrome)